MSLNLHLVYFKRSHYITVLRI